MKLNGKISYLELEQLVFVLKKNIVNSYLKKIYHYQSLWLFKFNHHTFIYDPGVTIWIGTFTEREDGKNLHSICKKFRKELSDRKIISVDIVNNDRTMVISFYDYKLVFELYSQGNMILLDKNNKIVKVHREIKSKKGEKNNYVREHDMEYNIDTLKNYDNYITKQYIWKKLNQEIFEKNTDIEIENEIESESENFNIYQGLQKLWSIKYQKKLDKTSKIKAKKNKFSIKDNIHNQIKNFNKKMDKKDKKITQIENLPFDQIDYKQLGELYSQKKKVKHKLEKAEQVYHNSNNRERKRVKKIIPKIELVTHLWYQNYYWWYTKNGFLVVGGKDSTDNEKLVKTYLGENDYYFHTEEAGSGSFILITNGKIPDDIDLDETGEGVLSLSTQWNSSYSSGKVFYVMGNQVSKTPPAGEYLVKGSFMIYGKKTYIRVDSCQLGYGLYNGNQLMLAPYRIVKRLDGECVKLTPRANMKKMKGKIISNMLKKKLHIILSDDIRLFNKPCYVN